MRRIAAAVAVLALILSMSMGLMPSQVAAQDTTFPVTARFVNAMTTFNNLFVSLNSDDNKIVDELDYGQISDPVELTAPVSEIIVKQNENLQFDKWLYDTIVPTQAGQEYVIIISDLLLIPTQVDTSAMAPDAARGRIVNASAQSPALDVLVNDSTTPVVTALKYGSATDSAGIAVGTSKVVFNATGTTTAALTVDSVTVNAGSIYTWIVIGNPSSTEKPLAVVAVTSAPSGAAAPATPVS
jgi:hypothetical protein